MAETDGSLPGSPTLIDLRDSPSLKIDRDDGRVQYPIIPLFFSPESGADRSKMLYSSKTQNVAAEFEVKILVESLFWLCLLFTLAPSPLLSLLLSPSLLPSSLYLPFPSLPQPLTVTPTLPPPPVSLSPSPSTVNLSIFLCNITIFLSATLYGLLLSRPSLSASLSLSAWRILLTRLVFSWTRMD